ncbi:uncharacterized protein [Montipora capricornis]|uniref:uncharacterized protein n=1 Tax=Montipora capricornis TaxID=246305 RepID=UPI0035F14A52
MPNDQIQSEGSSVSAEVGQTSSGDSGGNSAAVDQVFSMFKDFLEKKLEDKGKQIEHRSKLDKEVVQLKFKGNQKQFDLNAELDIILESIEPSTSQTNLHQAPKMKNVLRRQGKLRVARDAKKNNSPVIVERDQELLWALIISFFVAVETLLATSSAVSNAANLDTGLRTADPCPGREAISPLATILSLESPTTSQPQANQLNQSHDDALAQVHQFTQDYELESGHSLRVKGNLKNNLVFWRSIGAPDFILSIIANGYRLPFISFPLAVKLKNNKSARIYACFVDQAVLELLNSDRVHMVNEQPFVVNLLSVSVQPCVLDGSHVKWFTDSQVAAKIAEVGSMKLDYAIK